MRVLLLALAGAASLATAAPALAQSVGMRSTPDINLTGFNADAHVLPNAVTNIEKLSGGRVAEIRFHNVKGVPGYDVALAQGDHIRFQRYTKPNAKMITLTESTTPAWMLDWRGQKNMTLVQNAKVPLADAIRTAEGTMRNAPAVAAGIAHGASSPTTAVHAYNVSLLVNGAQHRVAVNSDSGAVISNPQALPRW